MDALSAHYGLPGRLADYRQQFDIGGGGHQAEVYAGSGGRSFPMTASGCSCPGSCPSSGPGSSGGGEVVTASGGGNACYGGGVRACGIGDFAQIVALGACGASATASTGILPA